MNEPSAQSLIATPQTPLAMLMPDQGTTPTRRSTDRRTHADDLDFVRVSRCASPSRALRVMSSARGKKREMNGARGMARRVARTEPMVVSAVRRMVAIAGDNSAPATTFCQEIKCQKRRSRDTC